MSKRMMLVAASALAALAFAALPAFASAAASVDNVTGVEFSGTFGTATLTSSNGNVVCKGENHASGKFTSSTTGTVHVLFTSCSFLGFTCTGSGLSSGQITVTGEFHVINIDPTTAAALVTVTPLKFSCLGQTVEIKGSVIGDASSPACNGESNEGTGSFSGTGGVQQYQQIETTGTKFHLESNINGGAFSEASYDATATAKLNGGVKGKLTC